MRKLRMLGAVLVIAVIAAACDAGQTTRDYMALETTNYRTQNGVPNPPRDLDFGAQIAANMQVDNNGGDHGTSCNLSHAFADSQGVSENLACLPHGGSSKCNPAGAVQAMQGWKSSPGHWANWLNPAWNHFGVGAACNDGVIFVVQWFDT